MRKGTIGARVEGHAPTPAAEGDGAAMLSAPEQSRFVSLLTKTTLALILAGGRGARLSHLTDWRAKPAVPFGGKFRIIDFPLSNCMNSGIRRIGVVTQYKAHSLIRHIQRGWGFLRGEFGEFVELMPASQRMEETWYKGTADSIYQNLDIIRAHSPERVLILAGDQVYKMDYGQMLAFHAAHQADVTVGCIEVPVERASAFGVMAVDGDDRIVEFAEKPLQPKTIPGDSAHALASMGIYVFDTEFLIEQLTRDADEMHSTHDFGRDLIPYCASRYRSYAHRFSTSCVREDNAQEPYWRDVGTVDAYWEANVELTKVTPLLNLYDANWPIWTYQEQVPPAKFVFDDPGRRGVAIDSMVAGGTIISGATVERSLLFTNIFVHSFSSIQDSVILPDVSVGRHSRLTRVVVDKGCEIPEGLVVGEDALEDARRFHRTEEGITLLTPDMLGQRVHHGR
jgi:glucose-1-phosphate adenylyltransferase